MENIWTIHVRCNRLPGGNRTLDTPVLPDSPLTELVEFVNEVITSDGAEEKTVIDVDYTKLFCRGKLLDNYSSVAQQGLCDGDTVLLVFSSKAEVAALGTRETKESLNRNRLRTMEEEEAIEAARRAAQNREVDMQDATYKFCKFKICDRFVTPHPFEAMRLLERLATDPAIKRIMRTHEWTVGSLEEMDPRTDMVALRKETEAGDGACVLGYNENAGHRIFLRLRNDAETEFRSYNSLVNTLLHELTHNVHGPHDDAFWKLFAKLKADYLRFHQVERGTSISSSNRSAATLDQTDAQVMWEIRSQGAGNSALQASERAAALRTASASASASTNKKQVQVAPSRLGAANSRARMMEREKLAQAAERRFAKTTTAAAAAAPADAKPDQHESCGGCCSGKDDASPRERAVRQAIQTMCQTRNADAVKLAHTIVKNALTGEAKYLTVKTTGERFRTIAAAAPALLLLLQQGLGFEQTATDSLHLTTSDPKLLHLAKSLLEDSGGGLL